MREILFRGKRIDNGEWVLSGNIIRFNPENGEDLIFIPALGEPCICDHDENDNIISFEKGMFYKVDTKTVGQFTGLTDKNGKRIFEGDILEFRAGRSHIVKFDDGCFIFTGTAIPVRYADKFEVIGNIHDNHELLGG